MYINNTFTINVVYFGDLLCYILTNSIIEKVNTLLKKHYCL